MPEPKAPDVRLKVGGTLYGGWKEIRIQRSMEQIAGKFDLAVTERWEESSEPRPIRPGEECQVLIDDEPVITGYVDDVEIGYDANSHTVAVSGRDRTGDLVDCSGVYKSQSQWYGRTILDVANILCKPFGIAVSADVDVGPKFISLTANQGDTAFDMLSAAAQLRAVMLISDGLGGLLITRASDESIPASLSLSENIVACSANFTGKDRYSKYTVKADKVGSDNDWGDAPWGEADDVHVQRYRPLIIVSEKPSDHATCRRIAEWERNVRFGKSQRISYTVQGWHYAPGKPWPINRRVVVDDKFLGASTARLITGVTFIADSSGVRAELMLMWPEAMDLVALPEKDSWDSL